MTRLFTFIIALTFITAPAMAQDKTEGKIQVREITSSNIKTKPLNTVPLNAPLDPRLTDDRADDPQGIRTTIETIPDIQVPAPIKVPETASNEPPAKTQTPAPDTPVQSALETGDTSNQSGVIENADNSVTFSPDYCDFQISFPEAPREPRRCPAEANGKCYRLNQYMKVYDLKTSIDVSVTCVPSNPQKFNRYNEPIMRAALNGMVKRANVESFDIGYFEGADYKSASLNGSGGEGRNAKIYSSQIWSGPNSVMTVEATLNGPSHPNADTDFATILQTLVVK